VRRSRLLSSAALLALSLASCEDARVARPAATLPPLPALTPERTQQLQQQSRVLLVTLDGVRWQDFFDVPGETFADDAERPLFAFFWQRLAPRGIALGDASRNSSVRAAGARAASLPSYQAMLAGATQPCDDNECGAIGVETFLESIARRLSLPDGQVAVFASWRALRNSVARDPSALWIDVGEPDPERDAPWDDSRWDEETFARATAYLERERPRLFYLALGDADKWAHENDEARYKSSLRRYDGFLERLAALLESLGPDFRDHTTLILTSDHGRGDGWLWRWHQPFDSAQQVFLAAVGPYTRPGGRAENGPPHSLADLRPTIELLFGLEPAACDDPSCGRPIPELVEGLFP